MRAADSKRTSIDGRLWRTSGSRESSTWSPVDQQVVVGRRDEHAARDEGVVVPGVADVERGVRVEEPGEQLARAGLAVLGDDDGRAEARRQAAQHDLERAQPAPRGPEDDEGDGHEMGLRAHAPSAGGGRRRPRPAPVTAPATGACAPRAGRRRPAW